MYRSFTFPEALFVGQVFDLGSYKIDQDEIVSFAKKYDPIPIHVDPVAAGPQYGGVIASGINTIAIYENLFINVLRAPYGVGRTLNFRFVRPVYPGTVLTGQSTILKITLRPERHDAIVLVQTLLRNDAQELVLTADLDALMCMSTHPAAAGRDSFQVG